MNYVAQMLPDLETARLMMTIFEDWIYHHRDEAEYKDDVDRLRAIYAKLSQDVAKHA